MSASAPLDDMTHPVRPVAVQPMTVWTARSTAELDGLAPAWTRLQESVPDCSLSQTHRYARQAWSGVHAPRGDRLGVVTVWNGARLDLVWPLSVTRRPGHTLAAQLGNTSEQEYAVPLVRPGPRAEEAVAAAVRAARRLADVLAVRHLPARLVPTAGPLGRVSFTETTTSHVACGPTDTWLAGRPQKLRWEMRRNHKRLHAAGEVALVSSDDDRAAGHEAITWVFERKREWLAQRGLARDWITSGTAEGFFHGLLDDTDTADPLRLVVIGLRLDGRIVSASICYRSKQALEGFVIAFDESLSRLAPGNVLMEACLRAAFEDGLAFDFRIDPFDYKLRWSDREVTRYSQVVPGSLRGVPFVLARHASRSGTAARVWLSARRPLLARARAFVARGVPTDVR